MAPVNLATPLRTVRTLAVGTNTIGKLARGSARHFLLLQLYLAPSPEPRAGARLEREVVQMHVDKSPQLSISICQLPIHALDRVLCAGCD
jgi:hypothetical protein